MEVQIEESWKKQLKDQFNKDYFNNLVGFVKNQYRTKTCYPPGQLIFNAFDHCPFDNVKVVIIGQDPYHGPGMANGLCFSVNPDVTIPRSLSNIFLEIKRDLGKEIPSTGDLERWADQGVLLLNATLTVEARKPGSHQNKGWEEFTDSVIQKLNKEKSGIVYMLWGKYAQNKGSIINTSTNLVLKTSHPSPFSVNRGFLGCGHFSACNEYLKAQGQTEINW